MSASKTQKPESAPKVEASIDPVKLDWRRARRITLALPIKVVPAVPDEVVKGEKARAGDFVNITHDNNHHLMFAEEITKDWKEVGKEKLIGKERMPGHADDCTLFLPSEPWRVLRARTVLNKLSIEAGRLEAPAAWAGHPGWVITSKSKRYPVIDGVKTSEVIIQYPVYERAEGQEATRKIGYIGDPNFDNYKPVPAPR